MFVSRFLVIVSMFANAHMPWDDPKLIIGIRRCLGCFFLGVVGETVPGSTPRPLEMLGDDQRFVDRAAAKWNPGGRAEQ